EADLDRLYRVNVKGVYLCARAAVRLMLDQGGGVILNMASIASLVGVADRFAYSMTKGAVLTMTMSIAIDYVKQHIRCNCICPARGGRAAGARGGAGRGQGSPRAEALGGRRGGGRLIV